MGVIAEHYKAIFESDPVLLDAKGRGEYLRSVLKNLFITRTAYRSDPTDLDKAKQVPPPEPAPVAPDDTLKDEYVKSRRLREVFDRYDLLKPLTMAFHARHTNRRATGAYATHATVPAALLKDRMRIAAIGYRVKVSAVPDANYFGEELCAMPEAGVQRIVGLQEYCEAKLLGRTRLIGDHNAWLARIHERLTLALAQGPHIVLLPEFSLPSALPKKKDPAADQIRDLISHRGRNDALVFAGTRHEGAYNRGLLLAKTRTGLREEWHYKVASAKKLGENVVGSADAAPPFYIRRLTCGNDDIPIAFMVAICYDAFDPTVFLSLLRKAVDSGSSFRHLFILVPSFNTSEDFVALLRDMSFMCRCCVLYINGLHGDAKLYAYGFSVSEILANEANMAQQIKDAQDELDRQIAAHYRRMSHLRVQDPRGTLTQQELERINDKSKRKIALTYLTAMFNDLVKDGALQHLITIEEQPKKDGDAGEAPGDDILYYNLDLRLLEALKQFREMFFLDDKELPPPFDYQSLSRSLIETGGS